MKQHIILKNLMIAIPAVIILLSFVTQTASVEQVWFLATLATCLGAGTFRIANRITAHRTPLGWVLGGAVMTVFFLAFELAGGNPMNWPEIVVLILSVCEALLAILYWVGRRMALLP